MSNILKSRVEYKPFHYPWAYDAFLEQNKMHWMAEEVPMEEDVNDWNTKLTEQERTFLTHIFRFFTQGDVDVASGYIDRFLPLFKHPELRMMMGSFVNAEGTHVEAYSKLIDTVGMPESEYSEFLKYTAMVDKHNFISKNFNPYDADGYYDYKKIAKELAIYSAFTEGLQLFSSFAMLLNFPRFGKMKGMGQIVTWSIRDECYSDDTEVLTDSGWKLFKDLDKTEKVAQYHTNGSIDFVKPLNYVEHEVEEDLVHIYNKLDSIDILVTKNHRIPYFTSFGVRETTAEKFIPSPGKRWIVSGFSNNYPTTTLTPKEKLLIALEVLGEMPAHHSQSLDKESRIAFFYAYEDYEKEKLRNLLPQISPTWGEEPYGKGVDCTIFHVDIPTDCPMTKNFKDWIDVTSIDSSWGRDFIRELSSWFGGEVRIGGKYLENYYYYSSEIAENIDTVQAVAAISTAESVYRNTCKGKGWRIVGPHTLEIKLGSTTGTEYFVKENVPYKGKVYCVTVPSGNIVVRRNNRVAVCGNCLHVESMIKVFQTIIHENPSIWTDEFKKEIYDVCRTMVDLEDKFIELAFESGGVQGIDIEDIKMYVRHIADRRLLQLGLKTNYGVKDNPLPWLEEILNTTEHTNFFEQRVTEYSKQGFIGEWY